MKKYKIIYADPPWNYKAFGFAHAGRQENQYYKPMRMVDIYDIPIKNITEEDCVLFMWAVPGFLPEAIHAMKCWGFDYKTIAFNWVKTNPKSGTPFFGMGSWTRMNSEICLIGTKGKPVRKSRSVSQIVITPLERHSEKPNEVRKRIIELMGDLPRVELFARQKVDGWDSWGNEVENDIEL